jgi:hypothetical protein
MDRRRTCLVLLLVFVGCTCVAILLSGSRPGLEQGLAPAAGLLVIAVATVPLVRGLAAAGGIR